MSLLDRFTLKLDYREPKHFSRLIYHDLWEMVGETNPLEMWNSELAWVLSVCWPLKEGNHFGEVSRSPERIMHGICNSMEIARVSHWYVELRQGGVTVYTIVCNSGNVAEMLLYCLHHSRYIHTAVSGLDCFTVFYEVNTERGVFQTSQVGETLYGRHGAGFTKHL